MDTVVVSLDSLSKAFLHQATRLDSVIFSFDSSSIALIQQAAQGDTLWDKFIVASLALASALALWFISRHVSKKERNKAEAVNTYITNGTNKIVRYTTAISYSLNNYFDRDDLSKQIESYDTVDFPTDAAQNIGNLLNGFKCQLLLEKMDTSFAKLKKVQKKYLFTPKKEDDRNAEDTIKWAFVFFIHKAVLQEIIWLLNFHMQLFFIRINGKSISSKSLTSYTIFTEKEKKESNSRIEGLIKGLDDLHSDPFQFVDKLPKSLKKLYDSMHPPPIDE
ncbi:MAG: hypothetical protein FVQ81_12185 [Candidatus Glassbacteria bacterium]|nr:hypothetical protein [Candidatus Glassbacteria bacterium]